MGKQPAVLIIARHGTRLDQGDKEWQNKSSEPWNSPLSYGGWIQSQGLGARIANELQNLDNESSSKDSTAAGPRPRKRRKIMIHSSPYLRCIQTSVGIAAGIKAAQETPRVRPVPTPHQRSSLSKPPMLMDDATSPPIDEHMAAVAKASARGLETSLTDMKIDSWLGEWLSAGYFEKSKSPPPSAELVKSAKELLKIPPEEIKGADLASSIQEFDEFDWADTQKEMKDPKNLPTHEKTGLRAMAAKGYSMPRRTRTTSLTFGRETNGTGQTSEPTGRRPRSSTYSPPVPTYSIAPQDKIPIGFVAHARDACIDTDFEWDSEQSPLSWGDGGQYEEEWSTMHRRFARGLQNVLSHYDVEPSDYMEIEEEDAEEDVVLILVTHQAGCNALIRLVTGAPALHDVGTASLTLAVRKQGLTRIESSQSSVSPTRRRGSLDLGISDDYEMRIIASVEHLRASSNPFGLNSPRLGVSPAFASRRMVGAESVEGFSIGDPLTWRSSSSTTIGRSPSLHSRGGGGSISNDSLSGSGLWSMRDTRSGSVSSDTSVDPRTTPTQTPKASTTNVSSKTIHEDEDEAMDDWMTKPAARHAQEFTAGSPTSIEGQSTWQPTGSTHVRLPVRSGSTRITGTGSSSAVTGLWGSPVTNPGGVKEGTPHSRGSFGMSDAAAPMWGPRSSTQRFSWQSSKGEMTSTKEEDES